MFTEQDLERIVQLTLGVAMNCEQRQEVIMRVTQELDESTMQELQVILEQVIEQYLPVSINLTDNTPLGDNSLNISGLSQSNKDMFNFTGQAQVISQGGRSRVDISVEDVNSSTEEATTPAKQLALMKKHGSP